MTTAKVGCINIPTSVGKSAWERCFIAALTRSDVFGVNEAFHPAAKDLYDRLCKRHEYGHVGLAKTGNPIFWNKAKYTLVDSGDEEIHGRGPGYDEWPGFNDARGFTWAILRPKGALKGDGEDFMVINTHLVPNGPKVVDWWRVKVRAQSWKVLREVIKAAVHQGLPCFLLGDMNVSAAVPISRLFRWIKGVGIDKVGLGLPPEMKRGECTFVLYAAPTDHHHGVATVARWDTPTERGELWTP